MPSVIIEKFGSLCLKAGTALIMLCLVSGCGRRESPAAVAFQEKGPRVLAEVVWRSQLPDPAKCEYPDCDFSCEMLVHEISSTERTPRRIVVMLPGFRKRVLHGCSTAAAGDVLDLTLVSASEASQEMKTRQRADSLENFDLPVYYALDARRCDKKAASFEARPDSYFAQAAPEVTPAAVSAAQYPWSEKAARDRSDAIARDREALLSSLKANGGSWDAWSDRISPFIIDINEKAHAAGGSLLKDGDYFERLHWKQYKSLSKLADEEKPGPVKMLEQLSRGLRARGIDLIVVPFPYKEEITAEVFSDKAPADGWCEPWRQKFIMQLLERDVEVVDLVPALRAARGRFRHEFYDVHDSHPAQGAILVAAEEIARRLRRYDLAEHRRGPSIQFQTHEAEFVCDADSTAGGYTPGRRYPATQVLDGKGRPLEITDGNDSSVVILGDSYTVVPNSLVPSSAIPEHLAHCIGEVPNRLGSLGNSDEVMKQLAREGGSFLRGRCAMVFVFAPTKLDGEEHPRSEGRPWNWVNLPPITLPEGGAK